MNRGIACSEGGAKDQRKGVCRSWLTADSNLFGMGRIGAGWKRLRRRTTDSRRLLVVRLLWGTSKPLTVGFTIDLLGTSILPNVVIVAMGSMVGRIPVAVR